MCYTWYRVLILVPRVHVVYFSSLSQVVVCPDELVQACLCTRKDLESCLDQFESPLKLLQVCLSAWKDLQSNFLHCGGTVKHARTCFSAEMVGENSFDRVRSTMELV